MPEFSESVRHESTFEVERWDPAGPGTVSWRTLAEGHWATATGMTTGVAEIEPGAADYYQLHRHAAPEVYYFIAGEGIVVMGGREHSVRPGSVVTIPGDTDHAVRNTGTDVLRLFYVFPVGEFSEVAYVFDLAQP